MSELVASILVTVFLGGPLLLWIARFEPDQRRPLRLAVFAHIAASVSMVLVVKYYYGYGDMLGYFRGGIRLSHLLSADFGRFAPHILRLIFELPNDLPDVIGNGRPTGTMFGIAASLAYITGASLFASCILVSLLSLSGNIALYAALSRAFSPRIRGALAWAVALLPSLVYWSAGILKESIAMAGLGWTFWGLFHLLWLRRRRLSSIAAVVVGTVTIALTKPYILYPFGLASIAALYWTWALAKHGVVRIASRPGRLLAAVVIGLALVSGLSALFPRYSAKNVQLEAARLRALGGEYKGGSSYTLLDDDALPDSGPLTLMVLAPVGLFSALFRPLIFEVTNPLVLVSALEVFIFFFLIWRILAHTGIRRAYAALQTHPVLVFCVVFVLVFSVGVGISTTNLGSLSRYRTPMLPFYMTALLSLAYLSRARAPARVPLGRPVLVHGHG